MLDFSNHRREIVVDVDAAVVGISRDRWEHLPESDASQERAREIMATHLFDVLPISSPDGRVREYFHTVHWNDYDTIERSRLGVADVLPSGTSIRDVVKEMAEKERLFFFLTTQSEVSGLISVANLNSRQVQVFLFALFSELEKRLGYYLEQRVSYEVLVSAVERRSLGRRFRSDRRVGLEENPLEYLGFQDLVDLARDSGIFEELDLTGPEWGDAAELRLLRNRVAHPIKSVVDRQWSVSGFWSRIRMVEDLLFRLRMVQARNFS